MCQCSHLKVRLFWPALSTDVMIGCHRVASAFVLLLPRLLRVSKVSGYESRITCKWNESEIGRRVVQKLLQTSCMSERVLVRNYISGSPNVYTLSLCIEAAQIYSCSFSRILVILHDSQRLVALHPTHSFYHAQRELVLALQSLSLRWPRHVSNSQDQRKIAGYGHRGL